MYEVSVIVLTYNSKWEKLKYTLESIIKQKQINLQILISDDGSQKKCDDEIKKLMQEYTFSDYRIINNKTNAGTVLNIANALQFVEGEYTKLISPGDYLYTSDTMHKWISWMKENCIQASFGDAIYYLEYNEMNFVGSVGSPVNKTFYNQDTDLSKMFVDYVVANDTILGASQLMESNVLNKYISQIKNQVIFAEDYIMRLMIYDGIRICFFDQTTIMYEYGNGISTKGNKTWAQILHKDFETTDKILLNRCPENFQQKKYRLYLSFKNNKYLSKFIKIMLFPNMFSMRLKMRNAQAYIPKDANKQQAKWIEQ